MQSLARLAARIALTTCLVFSATSCATRLPRFEEPARLESIALGTTEGVPDLLLVDIAWGFAPISQAMLVLRVPPSGRVAEPVDVKALQAQELDQRAQRFTGYTTESWSREQRLKEELGLPKDFAPAVRRNYAIRNHRDESGAFDIEIERRTQGADGARVVERVTRFRLPEEMTPADVAPVWLWCAAVPLAIVDLAWIPISAASFVLLLPFGSYLLLDEVFTSKGRW
jgi:hypothetical protein